MAVRPVDPLGDDIKGNSCWRAEPALYQLETIAAIHEGTFELRLHIVTTHVCEEHVATNQKKKKCKRMLNELYEQNSGELKDSWTSNLLHSNYLQLTKL